MNKRWWWPFVGHLISVVSGIEVAVAVYWYITGEPAIKIVICIFAAIFLFSSATLYTMKHLMEHMTETVLRK